MNSFLRTCAHNGWQHKVTASLVPGTTIGMLGLPFSIFDQSFARVPGSSTPVKASKNMYDTPGIVNPNQLLHLLTHEELEIVIPKSPVKPKSYRIDPGMVSMI